MKNIIIILNESHIPHHVIATAIKIARESNSLIEAVFINDMDVLNLSYPFFNDMALIEENVSAKVIAEQRMLLMKSIIRQFRDDCDAAKVDYKINVEHEVSLSNLVALSHFADLVIADNKSDSNGYSLQDILADAHCPVLLVDINTQPVTNIHLAYDGSPAGMFAIKMFSYIFPEYQHLPTQLIYVADKEEDKIPHLNEIRSWALKHFIHISFKAIVGNAKKELVENVRQHSEKAIVVMGAYSGSAIGRLFVKSTADSIINETNASLFITHN